MTVRQLNINSWVDRYADYMFNYAISRLGDAATAKDLVRETFLAGSRTVHDFDGSTTERTWLIAILKGKVDGHRKKYSRKEIEKSGQDLTGHGTVLNSTKGRAKVSFLHFGTGPFKSDELSLSLLGCMAKLGKEQSLAFSMKTISGMGTVDICKELNIEPRHFWVLVHQARSALIECLNKGPLWNL